MASMDVEKPLTETREAKRAKGINGALPSVAIQCGAPSLSEDCSSGSIHPELEPGSTKVAAPAKEQPQYVGEVESVTVAHAATQSDDTATVCGDVHSKTAAHVKNSARKVKQLFCVRPLLSKKRAGARGGGERSSLMKLCGRTLKRAFVTNTPLPLAALKVAAALQARRRQDRRA